MTSRHLLPFYAENNPDGDFDENYAKSLIQQIQRLPWLLPIQEH